MPTVTLGLHDGERSGQRACSPPTNFPGASTANLNNARALYALLTGRVIGDQRARRASTRPRASTSTSATSSSGSGRRSSARYAQDSWRVTPTLTLNYGAALGSAAAVPADDADTFSTATLADLCGVSGIGSGPGRPAVQPLQARHARRRRRRAAVHARSTPATPGVQHASGRTSRRTSAWRGSRTSQSGWLRTILGDPEQATLRAGYSVSFNRERMDRFTGIYGNNPGGTTTANRNVTQRQPRVPGRDLADPAARDRRGSDRRRRARTAPSAAACVPRAPIYPIRATTANSLNIFDPDITLPYTQSWSVGFQRSLTQRLGDRSALPRQPQRERVDDRELERAEHRRERLHRRVQARAGQPARPTSRPAAARRSRTSAPGTGTSPLPIYLAYFTGYRRPPSDPARYTSTNFANTTWTRHLGRYNPASGRRRRTTCTTTRRSAANAHHRRAARRTSSS